jgi:hypothetical protein
VGGVILVALPWGWSALVLSDWLWLGSMLMVIEGDSDADGGDADADADADNIFWR